MNFGVDIAYTPVLKSTHDYETIQARFQDPEKGIHESAQAA